MKMEFLVCAAVLLLPLLMIGIIAALNHKKKYRYEQTLFPWAALVFAVLCCVFVSRVNQLLDMLVALPVAVDALNWLNGKSAWAASADLFRIYLCNVAVMAAFIIVKVVMRVGQWSLGGIFHGAKRIFSKKSEKRHALPAYESLRGPGRLHWAYINLFYNIDRGQGTVRSRFLPVGKVFGYAASVLTFLYLAGLLFCMLPIVNQFGWFPYDIMQQVLTYVFAWPAVSLVLLREVGYYLDGLPVEMEEEKELISCSAPESEAHANYASLADYYEKQFPERFVACLQAPSFPVENHPTELKSDLARAMMERLKQEQLSGSTHISQAVMDCVTALPERENALIDSVLSAELGDCLMLYLNVLLARGENLLVLCEDEDACNDVRDYVTEKLSKINMFAPVWIVRSIGEAYAAGDCDVLVLTPQAVMDSHVQHAQSSFFKHLTTVLMVNGSRLVSEMGGLLTLVSAYLARGKRVPLQYICLCNGISGELRITLEQLLSPGREFKPYECFKSDETNHILLWNYEAASKAENYLAQQNLFGEAMDHAYLGVMLPFAFAAVKRDVADISLMGKEVPAKELIRTIQASFSQMRQYFGSGFSLNSLTDKLAFNRIDADNPFVIVLDETCNLPMTLRNYCRQVGKETSMVHIVSKPYMLRDYFSAHAAGYLLDRKKAEMFAPILTDTHKMMAVKLIADAAAPGGLAEEKLRACIRPIVPGAQMLRDVLQACYRLACNGETCPDIDAVFSTSAENVYVPEKNTFERQRSIHLMDHRLFERVVGDIHPARVSLNDRTISLGIGRKDVYRYYLPDQAMIVDGSMYYIDTIDADNGVIGCGRKISAMNLPTDYYQHREYRLDMTKDDAAGYFVDMRSSKVQKHVTTGYTTTLYRNVQMEVDTLGFFAPAFHTGMLDLTDRTCYRALPEKVRREAFRSKENAAVLSLRFHGVDSQEADRLSFTLAVLLEEVMKTYFPYNWPCIAVCPVLHSSDLTKGSMMRENLAQLYPQVQAAQAMPLGMDEAQVLIIEDSENDTGILEAISRNRITPLSSVFSLLLDYLKWQLKGDNGNNIRGDYLHFGSGSVPDVLQLETVKDMLEQLETVHPSGIVWIDQTADSNYCYFCHKNLHLTEYVQLMGDDGKRDRRVCHSCAKRLLSRKDELAPLYQRARKYLTDTFGIELPRGLKVKFVSASTIRKQLNKNRTKGRVIGLAQKLKKTVWVETLSPEEFILATLVHELTHFWQFENIKMNDLTAVEGHASYLEVQFLKAEGYDYLARRTHNSLMNRTDDEYGRGYAILSEAMKQRKDQNTFTYMLEYYGKKSTKPAPVVKPATGGNVIQSTEVEVNDGDVQEEKNTP